MAGGFAQIVVAGTLIAGCGRSAVANDSDRGGRCTATAAVPEHIRTTSCDMMRAIEVGMSASPSFRRVVERVAALHGIVYLAAKQVVQSQTRRVIDGTLQHRVTVAGSYRLLYATVTPYSGLRPIPIIAHELQHAIEVLEANAMSGSEIDDLFERIGVRTAASTFETAAALNVQAAVAKELANGNKGEHGTAAVAASGEIRELRTVLCQNCVTDPRLPGQTRVIHGDTPTHVDVAGGFDPIRSTPSVGTRAAASRHVFAALPEVQRDSGNGTHLRNRVRSDGPAERPVRSSSATIESTIEQARSVSATFSDLVDDLRRLRTIVYVEPDVRLRVGLIGSTVHQVTRRECLTYLRVLVNPQRSPAVRAGLIAHELQHAREIAGTDVATEADIERLFQRIGFKCPGRCYETQAAREIEQRVIDEMGRVR